MTIALSLAAPAAASPADIGAEASHFAICTGRLTALMEHQWLLEDPEATATELRRDYARAVLEALMPAATTEGVPGYRLRMTRAKARADHMRLLETGHFGTDPRRARMAAKRADLMMRPCLDLLTRR